MDLTPGNLKRFSLYSHTLRGRASPLHLRLIQSFRLCIRGSFCEVPAWNINVMSHSRSASRDYDGCDTCFRRSFTKATDASCKLLVSSDGIKCNHLRMCGWCSCPAHTRFVSKGPAHSTPPPTSALQSVGVTAGQSATNHTQLPPCLEFESCTHSPGGAALYTNADAARLK